MFFVYRLIPPRPTFASDMSEDEMAIMGQHGEYWQGVLERGGAHVFGAVDDPNGLWGLAVIEAATDADARDLVAGDPAITAGLATFELVPMLSASVRG